MQIPKLSHLQFTGLGHLLGAPASGRDIRCSLRTFGAHKSGPAFYQLMARMEDAGLVEGWYEQQIVSGQIIRERHYKIARNGQRAWQRSRDFYRKTISTFEPEEGLARV